MENATNQWFRTTHWSVVLEAGDASSAEAQAALETLCRTYWYPVYAYVRRLGLGPHDAEDLAQGFFEDVLERKTLATVERQKGRFRTWLLVCLKNFLSTSRDRAAAQKRGGGKQVVSFDGLAPEERYRLEPVDNATPEMLFERKWALAVLERARERLQTEVARDKADSLELLALVFLEDSDGSYAEVGGRLGLSESAVKSRVSRWRGRYRDLIRNELAQTVSTQTEVEEELRYLVAVMKR